MSGRVLLISLRCNPAHIQLLIAYARAVQALGERLHSCSILHMVDF